MRVKLPGGGSMPPPTFRNLVTELASTALVCLGVLQSPITKQRMRDPERARHLIEMLAMLQRKTLGNLEPSESEYLDAVVEDLRAKYEGLTGESAGGVAGGASDEPDEPVEPDEPDEPDEPEPLR